MVRNWFRRKQSRTGFPCLLFVITLMSHPSFASDYVLVYKACLKDQANSPINPAAICAGRNDEATCKSALETQVADEARKLCDQKAKIAAGNPEFTRTDQETKPVPTPSPSPSPSSTLRVQPKPQSEKAAQDVVMKAQTSAKDVQP